MNSNEDFARYLGVDYDKRYGYIRICCPDHNDTHPSLLIYPEIDRGAYCFVCHKRYNWAWLAHLIKGIDYKEALKDLGQENLIGNGKPIEMIEETTFCDDREKVYIDAYNDKFNRCSVDYPQKMIDWLERKQLTKAARELDWRWHDGTIFKGWREGIVIPHRKPWSGDDIDYVRIREWNGEGFDKPKGSFKMTIEPYFSTFRPNSVQFLVEGESDSASIYAHGGSAVGIPGATSKKAINTVLATFNDLPFVKSVIVCGDNDEAGEEMNKLTIEAGKKITPRLVIRPFKHRLSEKGTDINDEHTKGLLRLPVQFTANYGANYDRQPWANKEFIEAIEKIEIAEGDGAEWKKWGNIYILGGKDGKEVDC